MAHQTLKKGYSQLVERLNRFPQGAPPSHLLFKILALLFSEEEAALVAQLPIRPFTAQRAAKIWKVSLIEAQRTLETLAGRCILLDLEQEDGVTLFVLPPPMAGFFEFSLMRTTGGMDKKLLSELFETYLNKEEDFARALFAGGQTQLGRIFVQEPAVDGKDGLHVLDYDRAGEMIRSATDIGIGICFCRHKKEHLGVACSAPQDICMTLNMPAASLIRHGAARRVDAQECLDLLTQAYECNLVQFGENAREGIGFICNCCRCCCEALTAARRFGVLNPIHTSNYLPEIDGEKCIGCGRCLKYCPVEAISYDNAEIGQGLPKAVLHEEDCLGCGICQRICPNGAIRFRERGQRIIPPLNSTHRIVLMALERGKLQHLIFDDQVLLSHRILGAVLGAILKLPPAKRLMAGNQVRSRYLENLSRKYG
ncbi:MAG: 4Fe-4S binding protein [Deltaproteobacteria bacterium]|nr:4Fe-4S binding protein [Deltaproteobacteria bacterium]